MLHALLTMTYILLGIPISYTLLSSVYYRKKVNITELILLSATLTPLYITYCILILGYMGWLSKFSLSILLLMYFFLPLIKIRNKLAFSYKCHIINKLSKDRIKNKETEIFLLSFILISIVISLPKSLFLPPFLRDPYAVWIFYGERIKNTGRIPLFYGNAPDISWSGNYPPLVSFLSASYFILLNDVKPYYITHFSWVYGCLTLLSTYMISKEFIQEKPYLLSSFLLLTSSLFTLELTNLGYTDIIHTFFILFSTYYLLMIIDGYDRVKTIYGIVYGAALMTKYLSIFFCLCLLTCIPFLKRRTIKSIVFGTVIAVIFFSPWLIRNYIFLYNPFYPFLNELFDGKGIDPEVFKIVPGHKYFIFSLLEDKTLDALANQDIGYVLLVYGFLGIFFTILFEKKILLKNMAFFSLFYWILIFISITFFYGYERYFLPILPLYSLFAAKFIIHLMKKGLFFKLAIAISVILFSLPDFSYFLHVSLKEYLIPSSEIRLRKYIEENIPKTAVVLTNEICLYFINRKAISIYNIKYFFLNNYTFNDILLMYNISYIIFNMEIDRDILSKFFLPKVYRFKKIYQRYPYVIFKVEFNEDY